MVCRNMCLRLYIITQASGSHYVAGGKYCSTSECYIFTRQLSCESCGLRVRANPHCGRVYKEKVRAKKTDCCSMICPYGLTKATQFIESGLIATIKRGRKIIRIISVFYFKVTTYQPRLQS
jgi:hypothetical protein